ncbi:MAG: SUMF1/EgtB/PvdO family nonheme iron enzyme [Planctomycetia bacterium]|nr:SUMF1/EgtB/PvdO family nonheme iron enzyme [Planctomycetia bacterium]
MRRLPLLAAAWLALCSGSAAQAEHRAVLLIGNSAYAGAPLASPPQDVRALAAAFRQRGFVVSISENVDLKTMQADVERFTRSVPTRGTAVVYFSGYALRGGQGDYADNFLLPLDAGVVNTASVQQAKLGVRWVLDQLRTLSGSEANILLVDGCYAHPKQNKTQDYTLRETPRFPAESLAVYAAPFGTVVEPAASGMSPLAKRLTDELQSAKPLAEIFAGLAPTRESTLENLTFLAGPASSALGLASQLKPGTKPGEEWVNEWGMVFCWCPAGMYSMGSPAGEPSRGDDEGPRNVTFEQGFWIAKYEFTRREIMTLMKRHTYLSTGTHKLQPLDKTRKDDVGQWLTILNGNVAGGWRYAVPKEEEWEYAARAGTTTPYYFGADVRELVRHANFADVNLYDLESGYYAYAERALDDGFAMIAKVGSYGPNAWGLHDICGNLSEHCDTPYEAANVKPNNYPNSVIRGGSWLSSPGSCRSAARNYFSFSASENAMPNHVGYRLMIRSVKP